MTGAKGTTMENPDCYFGDHDWRGGACTGCGYRLRCFCGVFASAEPEWWIAHAKRCPVVLEADRQEREAIERSWL